MRRVHILLWAGLLTTGCKGDLAGSEGTDGSTTGTDSSPATNTSASTTTSGSGSATDSSSGSATDTATTGTSGSSGATTATTGGGTTGAGTGSSGSTGGSMPPDQVIFLNFDGVTLTGAAEDDAPSDEVITDWAGTFAAHERPREIPEIIQHLETIWAPFNVAFVEERPATGPYAMVVITPDTFWPNIPGILGTASEADCGDQNPNSVVFAFTATALAPELVANVISGELGRSMGLDYQTVLAGDVMSFPYGAGMRAFADQCVQADDSNPDTCLPNHAIYCALGQQNSYQEILGLFGMG